MADLKKYSIKEEWEEHYKFLEALRRTGVTNMFGATPYLVEAYDISEREAQNILSNWMHNYSELNKKYGWQK